MDEFERDTQEVPKVDRLFKTSGRVQNDAPKPAIPEPITSENRPIILPGGNRLDTTGAVIEVSKAQIIHTIYRIAQISCGISWSNNIPRHQAGILASHSVAVHLCSWEFPFDEEVGRIINESVEDGLNHFYNLYGQLYTKPKGRVEINFKRKEQ